MNSQHNYTFEHLSKELLEAATLVYQLAWMQSLNKSVVLVVQVIICLVIFESMKRAMRTLRFHFPYASLV